MRAALVVFAVEVFWSTLKMELSSHQCFETYARARAAIFESIEAFYNREQLRSALGFQSPVEFETHNNLN